MHLTPMLKSILDTYKKNLSESEFISLELEVHQYIQQYKLLLLNKQSGVERGKELHRLINLQVESSSNVKVSCKNGCGACCHLEVQITQDDAEVLVEAIENGLDIDFDRLANLAERPHGDSIWKALNAPMNRCIFLSAENSCRVYESRPSVCRRHAVISPAEECGKHEGKVIPRLIPMAEIIMSACLQIEGAKFGSLANMLYSALLKKYGTVSKDAVQSCLK